MKHMSLPLIKSLVERLSLEPKFVWTNIYTVLEMVMNRFLGLLKVQLVQFGA